MTSQKQSRQQKDLSQQWLVEALLTLMGEKSYAQITISELSARADLSRRTFYRHFTTLDEVLAAHLSAISQELVYSLHAQQSINFRDMVRFYFEFWQQHKALLLVLQKNDLLHLLLTKFFPQSPANPKATKENPHEIYAYYFVVGGTWNLLVKWLTDGATQSPEEMAGIADEVCRHLI